MAKLLKLRRGTTTQHGSFTGAEGEVTIDTTKDTAVVHDGSQAGGRPLLREDLSNLPAGQIDNADINASAAIAGTKISPNFGSQNITTSGNTSVGETLTITGNDPNISFVDSNNNPDFKIFANAASLKIYDDTNSATRLQVNSDGHVDINGNLDVSSGIDVSGSSTMDGTVTINADSATPALSLQGTGPNFIRFGDDSGGTAGMDLVFRTSPNTIGFETTDSASTRFSVNHNGEANFSHNLNVGAGLDVTGNITVTGTVDGRDVASDGSKLDGIESGATADQTNAEIAAALSDQRPSMKGATFTDDGTSDPVINIKTDDASPWAVRIANDTHSTNTNAGFKMYQNSNGTGETWLASHDSAYEDWNIRLSNSSQNYTGITLQGSDTSVILRQGSTARLQTTSSGVSVTGDLTASGNVTAYSDARLKNEVTTINDALGIVGKLRGVSYKWLETDTAGIGVIAQEVEEVLPEVVVTTRGTLPSTGETTDIKSVDYGKIVGVLINAINELKAEVDALKKPKKKGGK